MSRDGLAAILAGSIYHGLNASEYLELPDWEVDNAREALAVILPLIREQIAREVEAEGWTWHFRGPGDPGIEIVSRSRVLRIIRGMQP